MKRLAVVLLGVVLLFFSLQANVHAGMKTYASLQAGVALPEFSPSGGGSDLGGKNGLLIGASIGIQPTDFFRWDTLQLSYFNVWQSKVGGNAVGFNFSDLSLGTGFRVGYFGRDWKIHPYATLGLDGSRSIYQVGAERESRWYFQWSVGFGAEYPVMDRVSLGARYQFSRSDYKRDDITESAHKISFEIIAMIFE